VRRTIEEVEQNFIESSSESAGNNNNGG